MINTQITSFITRVQAYAFKAILNYFRDGSIPAGNKIKYAYVLDGIIKCIDFASAYYFMNDISRVMQPNYLINQKDLDYIKNKYKEFTDPITDELEKKHKEISSRIFNSEDDSKDSSIESYFPHDSYSSNEYSYGTLCPGNLSYRVASQIKDFIRVIDDHTIKQLPYLNNFVNQNKKEMTQNFNKDVENTDLSSIDITDSDLLTMYNYYISRYRPPYYRTKNKNVIVSRYVIGRIMTKHTDSPFYYPLDQWRKYENGYRQAATLNNIPLSLLEAAYNKYNKILPEDKMYSKMIQLYNDSKNKIKESTWIRLYNGKPILMKENQINSEDDIVSLDTFNKRAFTGSNKDCVAYADANSANQIINNYNDEDDYLKDYNDDFFDDYKYEEESLGNKPSPSHNKYKHCVAPKPKFAYDVISEKRLKEDSNTTQNRDIRVEIENQEQANKLKRQHDYELFLQKKAQQNHKEQEEKNYQNRSSEEKQKDLKKKERLLPTYSSILYKILYNYCEKNSIDYSPTYIKKAANSIAQGLSDFNTAADTKKFYNIPNFTMDDIKEFYESNSFKWQPRYTELKNILNYSLSNNNDNDNNDIYYSEASKGYNNYSIKFYKIISKSDSTNNINNNVYVKLRQVKNNYDSSKDSMRNKGYDIRKAYRGLDDIKFTPTDTFVNSKTYNGYLRKGSIYGQFDDGVTVLRKYTDPIQYTIDTTD